MREDIAGCSSQQSHELTFGRFQRAVRHIVDEPDREVDIDVLRVTVFILAPLLRRYETGTDDQSSLFQQDGHVALRAPIPKFAFKFAANSLFIPRLEVVDPRRRPLQAPDRCLR